MRTVEFIESRSLPRWAGTWTTRRASRRPTKMSSMFVRHQDRVSQSALRIYSYFPDLFGTRKFFLEAKKPSVVLKFEKSAARNQLRRYAWSAKLPLSLTDQGFAEFCAACTTAGSKRRKKHDPALEGASVLLFPTKSIAEKWDEHRTGLSFQDCYSQRLLSISSFRVQQRRGACSVSGKSDQLQFARDHWDRNLCVYQLARSLAALRNRAESLEFQTRP